MPVLVYADAPDGKIHKAGLEAINYGRKIAEKSGEKVIALIAGECSNIDQAGKHGAHRVLHAAGITLSDASVPARLVAQIAEKENAQIVVFTHDLEGRSVAPRTAARLKAGFVPGADALPETGSGFTVRKSVFSGKAFANYSIKSDRKIISILPNSFQVEEIPTEASVEKIDAADLPQARITLKEKKTKSGTISLPEAERVVSGGRGLKGPENWGIIEDLAKELNAATACSRPVADSDWRPHHEHVGQTGVAIAPDLYIAVGISGAIQHLAGVNRSKVIVVINKDPEAPFFKAADYGIVGDAFEIVPKLTEAVKKFKASSN